MAKRLETAFTAATLAAHAAKAEDPPAAAPEADSQPDPPPAEPLTLEFPATHCPDGYVPLQVRVDPLTPRQALALKVLSYSLTAANEEVTMSGYAAPRRVENQSHAIRWIMEQVALAIEQATGMHLEAAAAALEK